MGTSRRWNVTTWGRHDVAATFQHCSPLLQFASTVCSFHIICTCIPRISHTQITSWKNTYLTLKITLKTKERRGYTTSVSGTHHTPKLNFLLVPNQEWTLNRTHTRHTETHTKTVLHMLRNRGSIWTDSHCCCFARSSQDAYRCLTFGKLS